MAKAARVVMRGGADLSRYAVEFSADSGRLAPRLTQQIEGNLDVQPIRDIDGTFTQTRSLRPTGHGVQSGDQGTNVAL
jgi:hypothetical protein